MYTYVLFLIDCNVILIFSFAKGLVVVGHTSMASSNPFFDDMRSRSGVDPPQTEESTEIPELINDPLQTVVKPNGTVSSSVRELLECPVCLNAMYPPIHQVVFLFMVHC
jgi:hypothetical protein